MKRFADAYARALFPRRYAPPRSSGDPSIDRGQGGGLTADGLDVAIAAACYRLVVAIEALLDAARSRLRRPRVRTSRRPTTTPAGCG